MKEKKKLKVSLVLLKMPKSKIWSWRHREDQDACCSMFVQNLDELGGCVSWIHVMIYIRLWEGNTYKSNGTSNNHSESGSLNVTSSTSGISNWGAGTTWASNDTRGSRWGSNTGRNSSARWIGDSWGLASGNIWGCSGAVETGGAWARVDSDGPGIMC